MCCFAFQVNAQKLGWTKVNLAANMLSKSPYSGHHDCYEMLKFDGIPIRFNPFILVDSLYISNDLNSAKVTFRYIHSINQIDTNDLKYYSLIEDSSYLRYLLKYKPTVRTKKFNNLLYCLNFYSTDTMDSNELIDSFTLIQALKKYNSNCKYNFIFDPCKFRYGNFGNIIYTKGKSKPKPIPNCYKISDIKKIKNDAQSVTIILPLKSQSVGIGYTYFELFEYFKTWNSKMQLMYQPNGGKMDVTNRVWLIQYDTSQKKTFASISLYNGGTDTLFLSKYTSTSSHIKINRFPNAIPPSTWGTIELIIDNTSLSYIPLNSKLSFNVKRGGSEMDQLTYLNYRIHR